MKMLIKICLWILAFTPLIMAGSVFFPFISGKSLLIRGIVALAAVLFLTHTIFNAGFRREILQRIKSVYKNPLFIAVVSFIALTVVSTILAVNKFRAFFGDVERGEGLIGWLFFFGFFLMVLLIFEKKDWIWFFKLSLIAALILIVKEAVQFFGGTRRPGSYTGNPTFLSGYLLFPIAVSWILFKGKEILWKYAAVIVGLLSVAGLFVTETRGTILGLFVGLVAVIIYGGIRGKGVMIFKRVDLRKASLVLLGFFILFTFVFIVTRTSDVWKKIPGLSRFAQISASDATANTRLIALGVSLKVLNPTNNGIEKTLVGWGPENFSIAYSKFYNPAHYRLEHEWFDRAHNKLMDVLVMNGVLGFLAYLALWGSFIWLIFKPHPKTSSQPSPYKGEGVFSPLDKGRERERFNESAGVLLFGAAYFIHLVFVFDQISTVIPFFGMLAFLIYTNNTNERPNDTNNSNRSNREDRTNRSNTTTSKVAEYWLWGISGIFAVFFLIGFIFWTLMPHAKMADYLDMVKSGDFSKVETVFTPYSYVQENIRMHFLSITSGNLSKTPGMEVYFDKALKRAEELIKKEPLNARHILQVGQAYEVKARFKQDFTLLKKAEEIYRKAYALAPMRQDVRYPLTLNLAYQGRYKEAIDFARETLKLEEGVPESHFYLGVVLNLAGQENNREVLKEMEAAFDLKMSSQNDAYVVNLYNVFLKDFYEKRDRENLLIVLERMKQLNPDKIADLEKAISTLKNGQWPNISFQ